MKAKYQHEDNLDPVERCRQARRELERQFATPEEYLDWLQALDKERVTQQRQAAKRKSGAKQRSIRQIKKRNTSRKSAKSRSRS